MLIAFGIALVYLLFLRMFSGVVVWLAIIGYFASLIALGAVCYNKAMVYKLTMDTNANDSDNYYALLALSIVFFVIAGLSFLILLCMLRKLQLAIGVIKTAAVYVAETPLALTVPPIITVFLGLFWAWWIVSVLYVYSSGTITGSQSSPLASVTFDTDTKNGFYYFIFGGLWVNAWI